MRGHVLRAGIVCYSLIILFQSVAGAESNGAKRIRLTHEVKAQLIDIADSLEEGSVPKFSNSALSDSEIIRFCFTYAMMHSRQKANGQHHFPAEQFQRISSQFFGRHFNNGSIGDASAGSIIKFQNGYYDGGSYDPTSSPGGYKVISLVQRGPNHYEAYLNSYGVPDWPHPAPYTRINISLRDKGNSGKHHFIVVGYSGEENQPTIQPKG